MKVAIAVDGNAVASHFGRCERYEVASIEGGGIGERYEIRVPDHQPGVLPRLMQQHAVTCVVVGGIGTRAQSMFAEMGITVIAGVSARVDEALAGLADGTLSGGESRCDRGTQGHRRCSE